ncbi:Uncharacterised protein [Bordetella pertussis]|nr:Uncharacterised protein [Bordetella pertussis]CFP09001.1 Uncharacterised protein [Bordetella pertussis]CFP56043.1 Uncharacterised protein [Bordetella pertussis]CFU49060.1 Uncharacterised protein [Bordetella pertussis]CPI30286.1 Uncharacterised protein [Bordetella pertussis]
MGRLGRAEMAGQHVQLVRRQLGPGLARQHQRAMGLRLERQAGAIGRGLQEAAIERSVMEKQRPALDEVEEVAERLPHRHAIALDFGLGDAGQARNERQHPAVGAHHLGELALDLPACADAHGGEFEDFARGNGQPGGFQVGHHERPIQRPQAVARGAGAAGRGASAQGLPIGMGRGVATEIGHIDTETTIKTTPCGSNGHSTPG